MNQTQPKYLRDEHESKRKEARESGKRNQI